MGPKNLSLDVFGMLKCMVTFLGEKIFEVKLVSQDEVIEVNDDTKSRAK